MTSEERKEGRYQRRRAGREAKRRARSEACGSFEQVFSYENLYKAGLACCKGVRWKCSTQRYLASLSENTARTRKALMDGTWKTMGFHEFDIMERGKLRHIRSVHISERVVQRCLCDNALVPLFSSAFIYDNAASLKGKGIDFAMDRMNRHLQRHYWCSTSRTISTPHRRNRFIGRTGAGSTTSASGSGQRASWRTSASEDSAWAAR